MTQPSDQLASLPILLRAVRRAWVSRHVLSAFARGALVVGTAAVWSAMLFPSQPRWPWAILLVAGPLWGWWRGRRSMPDDGELVLYVDQRLQAGEAIVSTWDAERKNDVRPADSLAQQVAVASLKDVRAKNVRPPVFSRVLRTVPFAALTLTAAFMVPVPPVVRAAQPNEVQMDADGPLRRIERLPELARTPDEEEELERIAEAAAELRHGLAEGMEQREALESIDRLAEQIEEAALNPETAEAMRAREAAVEALEAAEPEMARALAERNLEALDRAVERAAARREASDRQRAHEALEEAAGAAREAGDEALAESLLRRDRLLNRRSTQADLARQLAEAMPELMEGELGRQLERLARDGDGSGLDQATVDAMREAWSRLSAEERRRLAEAMRNAQQAENNAAREDATESEAMSADDYERMLREALEGLDETRGAVQSGAGEGIPMPGRGQGSGGQAGQGGQGGQGGQRGQRGGGQGQGQGGQGRQGQGSGAGGGGGGGGAGPEGGETAPVQAGDGPLARVRPTVRAGAPSRSWVEWTTPGAIPNTEGGSGAGTGASPNDAAGGGIERSRIPEDYEEHVRTYFNER